MEKETNRPQSSSCIPSGGRLEPSSLSPWLILPLFPTVTSYTQPLILGRPGQLHPLTWSPLTRVHKKEVPFRSLGGAQLALCAHQKRRKVIRKPSLISPISSSSSSSHLRGFLGFCCLFPSTISESRTCSMIITGFFLKSFANPLQSINNKFFFLLRSSPLIGSFSVPKIRRSASRLRPDCFLPRLRGRHPTHHHPGRRPLPGAH